MSLRGRLNKLEDAATSLPPSGAHLLNQVTRLRPEDVRAWMENRTDEELTALIRADGYEPANGSEFSDAELQAIISEGKKV